jgi:hypothetical protein
MSEYRSTDGRTVILLNQQMTARQFNTIMETRGCPVRLDPYSFAYEAPASMAAWDWLAEQVAQLKGTPNV